MKIAKSSFFLNKKGCILDYFEMINEALKITLPYFEEKKVMRYCLTHNEIILTNNMALYFCNTKEIDRGLSLFKRLCYSMNHSYVDETEKMRMYTKVLSNYSIYLSKAKHYRESLEITKEGERLAIKHKQLDLLCDFAFNRACALFNMKREHKETVPFFALCYYVSGILGKSNVQQTVANFASSQLGVRFEN